MNLSSILVGMAIGGCAFGLAWGVARHFTGLDREHGLALIIASIVGVVAGVGYILLESRSFDLRQRRKPEQR